MPQVRKRRVLVVDGNDDAAVASALLIKSIGHEVVTANNGSHAEKLVRKFRPEVVFMDWVLPDVDGCDLAKHLISELGSAVKVYVLTAYVDERAERRLLAAGCMAYFVKPLDPEILERVLS